MHLALQLIHLLLTEASSQKESLWKDCCQEAILKEGKQGEKAEVCQMTQDLD